MAEKVKAAIEAGVSVIACVGETLEEREKGVTMETVERQLKAIAGEVEEGHWGLVVLFCPAGRLMLMMGIVILLLLVNMFLPE